MRAGHFISQARGRPGITPGPPQQNKRPNQGTNKHTSVVTNLPAGACRKWRELSGRRCAGLSAHDERVREYMRATWLLSQEGLPTYTAINTTYKVGSDAEKLKI